MKKIYLSLIIIIMLSCLLAACVNDAGITPDTSLPQQFKPMPSPTKWPESYSAILEEYKTLADLVYHDDDYSFFDFIADNEDAFEWQEQNMPNLGAIVFDLVIDGSRYRERDYLGYALKDLNGDGSDELIILSKGYWVFAVYSTVDGKPKLVDSYADKYRCEAIDGSGLFYIYGSDGADDWSYGIYQLSNENSKLFLKAEYGMESNYRYDRGEYYSEPRYYKVTDGKSYEEREIIKEAEFDEFYEKHPAFADWENAKEITKSALVFIPILDCDNTGDATDMFVPPAAAPVKTVQIGELKKPRPGSAELIERNRDLYTLKSGENYVVYRFYNDDDEEDFFYYRIEVYNDDGKMIFHDEFDWPEPDIAYVSKDIIEIDMHTGTGASNVRYCDVRRGLVSEVFDVQHPILFVDGILIHEKFEPGLTLTAENVFDKTVYYKEFPLDAEICHLVELQLIDEQTIEIEYLRYDEDGELDKKTTITLS